MCDEHTIDETNEHLNGISRRQFNTLAASAAVATLLPQKAYTNNVNAKRVDVPTPGSYTHLTLPTTYHVEI